MPKRTAHASQSGSLAPSARPEALDELPRRILRSWMMWKNALDANYAAEELDGTVPTGAGLIMFALFERDGWKIGELAKRARVTHVAVVHLIEKLEAARLVKRKDCPDDSRVTRVWLTKRGEACKPQMVALHERNIATLTRVLGEADATQLGELLGRLIDGLAATIEPMPSVMHQRSKTTRPRL